MSDELTQCVECDAGGKLYEDPEYPPVEQGPCLCTDCYIARVESYICERLDEIEMILDDVETVHDLSLTEHGLDRYRTQ